MTCLVFSKSTSISCLESTGNFSIVNLLRIALTERTTSASKEAWLLGEWAPAPRRNRCCALQDVVDACKHSGVCLRPEGVIRGGVIGRVSGELAALLGISAATSVMPVGRAVAAAACQRKRSDTEKMLGTSTMASASGSTSGLTNSSEGSLKSSGFFQTVSPVLVLKKKNFPGLLLLSFFVQGEVGTTFCVGLTRGVCFFSVTCAGVAATQPVIALLLTVIV